MSKVSPALKQKWNDFLNRFTVDKISQSNNYDDYVIGKGSANKSFCYCVEVELKELGDIRASNVSKFGMWYGKKGSDMTSNYRATQQHFGGDVGKAFNDIKTALIELISFSQSLKNTQKKNRFYLRFFVIK